MRAGQPGAKWPGWWPAGAAAGVLLALYLALTARGLGGTGDSAHYLAAAHSLRTAGRLLGPDGLPYRYWGPLYPALLAVFATPGAARLLHGLALLGTLGLWAGAGRCLLPARRAAALPWALALSTALLVPAKFVWSETVFGLLVAAYAAALLAWQRTGRGAWLGWATAAGFMLPLQRTAGFFVLLGAGTGLLLTGFAGGRSGWRLAAHGAACAAGGIAWNVYAEVLAGPPRPPAQGDFHKLIGSLADYGFVLGRWFAPLGTGLRAAGPFWLWIGLLAGLLAALGPRRPAASSPAAAISPPPEAGLRFLWALVAVYVLGHALAATSARGATGLHDTERYLAALAGPVLLLALARWPAAGPGPWRQLLNGTVLAAWLGYSALRVGHNVAALQPRPPQAWPVPGSPAGGGGRRLVASGHVEG